MDKLCKRLCWKKNIPYKQALRDASPTYKTRNEIKQEVIIPKEEPKIIKSEVEPKIFIRKSAKKVVENITLSL